MCAHKQRYTPENKRSPHILAPKYRKWDHYFFICVEIVFKVGRNRLVVHQK